MKSDSAGDSNSVGLLVDQSRQIYETCKRLNVHCFASYQVASYHKDKMTRVLSESHLAGSKQVAEVADIVMVARDVYYDEFDGEKKDITPYRNVYDRNLEMWIKNYVKLEPNKKYLIIFLPKNRYGENNFAMVWEKLDIWVCLEKLDFVHQEIRSVLMADEIINRLRFNYNEIKNILSSAGFTNIYQSGSSVKFAF